MNRGDKLKLLQSRISNVENKLPIMLIGEAFKDIKEVEKICMENAKNNDELKNIVKNIFLISF